VEHLRQPVKSSVRVGTADRLDKCRNCIVMRVAVFPINNRPALNRLFRHFQCDMNNACQAGLGCLNCQFQCIQQVAGIPPRQSQQVCPRLRIQFHRQFSISPIRVIQSPVKNDIQLILVQGFQFEHAGTGDQRRDDIKIRIFCCRANQCNQAGFHVREEGILLSLVPTVYFIHKKNGSFAI